MRQPTTTIQPAMPLEEGLSPAPFAGDIDGHTNYPGIPKAIFLDTWGEIMGRLIITIQDKNRMALGTVGRVMFKGFQFKIPSSPFTLQLHEAGCTKLYDTNELGFTHSVWYADAGGKLYVWGKDDDWRCG